MAKRTLHKRTTRFISVMLSVLLVVNTLGLSAFAAAGAADDSTDNNADDSTGSNNNDSTGNSTGDKGSGDRAEMSAWASLQAEIDAAEDGAVIPVTEYISAESGDSALTIPRNKVITLELSGTLDRGLDEETDDGSVIINKGDLTITGGGTITGGNTSSDGGGIWSQGLMTLNDVNICNNHAHDRGGAVYSSYDHLELTDGEITGNSANYGGGFYVEIVPEAMTMQNGSIRGNNAKYGAGIYVSDGAGVKQNGGEISENRASNNGSGVYVQYAAYEMTGAKSEKTQRAVTAAACTIWR